VHSDTVSVQLYHLNWLLRARVVEAKLRALERTVKAGFDPNEPRVPAGNSQGGQWTSGAVAVGRTRQERCFRASSQLQGGLLRQALLWIIKGVSISVTRFWRDRSIPPAIGMSGISIGA
jgi:hypothetical protein